MSSEVLLPAPPISIDFLNDPAPGAIFMATWDRNIPAKYGNFIFILDKNGAVSDSIRINGAAFDFQVQQNGLLSYAKGGFSSNIPLPGEDLQHMVLDRNLAVIDSFSMKNGYTTDFHEFRMLPNGHAMMMAYHPITYDMSTIVEGGKKDATLIINIIQEQDLEKNVVFEWRNIDYIPIEESDEDLTASRINYSTLNAFDIDSNGDILASFRNHSEIMKISRETGEIIWRMGGPRSEYTFKGEHEENAPYYFARQHNIRKLQNGNLTLFDNGQFHSPPYSRCVEYELDEDKKVATLVSEWRYPNGNIFSATAGNAFKLAGGGWFIGYGVPHDQFIKRNAVEVHADGSIALELTLPDGVLAYRLMKLPWEETVDKRSFTHYEVKEGDTYSYNNDSILTGVEITYNSLGTWGYNESRITRVPYGPVQAQFIDCPLHVSPVSLIYDGLAINSASGEFRIDLSVYPEIKDPENTSVYYRPYPGNGLFIELNTSFDSGDSVLITTVQGFGELVFGVIKDLICNTPILYDPPDMQEIWMEDTVTLRWTGKGMYDSFIVQVSTDSTFCSILKEFNQNLSEVCLIDPEQNRKYFWRVKSALKNQNSIWSDAWSFYLADTTTNSDIAPKDILFKSSLQQNYPNPFHSSTRICYTIQSHGNVTIEITDQTGRLIHTLISEEQVPGSYKVNFTPHALPDGIYFYKIQAGGEFTDIKKMILIRE